MNGKIVSDHLSILHHEANLFELCDIGNRIAAYRDQIGELSRFNCTDAVLPAQHLCCINGDGTNDIEAGHSRVAQIHKRSSARLPARLAW